MHERVIVSVGDLRMLAIHCRHCSTSIELDLRAEFEPPRSPFRIPRECPRCENPFDSAVVPAVENMQRVYKALAGLGDAVTFASAVPPPAKP